MMDIDLQDEYRHIGQFYDEVEALLEWPDDVLFQVNADVSAWSSAQQLFHILRANGMMFKGIQLICHGHRIANNEGEPNDVVLTLENEFKVWLDISLNELAAEVLTG